MDNDAASIPGLNFTAFLRLIKGVDTQAVFDLLQTMAKADNAEAIVQSASKNLNLDEGLQQLYRDRYAPPMPSNEELVTYPEKSLGWRLGDHLVKNGLTLDFKGIDKGTTFDRQETFLDYARLRTLRIHDILHIVTGYDTTPFGEGQLAAFQAAQYGGAFHALNLSWLTVRVVFFESANLHDWLKLMNKAFAFGLRARPCYGIPWESHLAEDLDALRERLGLVNQ